MQTASVVLSSRLRCSRQCSTLSGRASHESLVLRESVRLRTDFRRFTCRTGLWLQTLLTDSLVQQLGSQRQIHLSTTQTQSALQLLVQRQQRQPAHSRTKCPRFRRTFLQTLLLRIQQTFTRISVQHTCSHVVQHLVSTQTQSEESFLVQRQQRRLTTT